MDLLLISTDVPDIDTWDLVRRVRILHPGAKWALLCREANPRQELRARTLGVLRTFCTMPDATELYNLAVLIREKTRAAVSYNKQE
jgi:hypothetical protein